MAKPYTAEEKKLLVQILKCHPIIESRKADATTIFKKATAWDIITKKFNAGASGEKRSVLQLKRCWDKLKRQNKGGNASKRRNLMATGGGPRISQKKSFAIDVDLVAPHVTTQVDNEVDNDALNLHKNDKKRRAEEVTEEDTKIENITIEEENKDEIDETTVQRTPKSVYTTAVDRLMIQRRTNAATEHQQMMEIHKIRLEIEKNNLEISRENFKTAKINNEIAAINLEIKKQEFGKLKNLY